MNSILDPDAYWPVCGTVLAQRLGRMDDLRKVRQLLGEFDCPRHGHLWSCPLHIALQVEEAL